MKNTTISSLLVVSLSLLSANARASDRMRIIVGEITPQGEIAAEIPEVIATVLTDAISSLGAFDVISRQDVQKVLQISQQRQLLGCEDAKCYTELAALMAADRLVSGTVANLGKSHSLSFSFIDLTTAKVENRVSAEVEGSTSLLVAEVRRQAGFLVSKALASRSGSIVLSVDHEGAEVHVDDKLLGVSPLAMQAIAGGPHEVRVSKEGFIDWSRDIQVEHDATAQLNASLIPSPEFARAYESGASLSRGFAWGTFGLALVGAASAVTLKLRADSKADELRSDAALVAGGTSLSALGDSADFDSRKGSIDTLDNAALSLGIVSIISAAASTWFFATGDEPGRYDAYLGQ